MSERYFVEQPVEGPTAQLTGSEAHHLAHVMRAAAGDEIVLFDDSGAEFAARVERVERAQIVLAVLERRAIDREAARRVTLGVALPKPDRARWLVEKATELGVAHIVPLVTERSNSPGSAALGKLRRAVIEASKQCGRNRLMEIDEPQALGELMASATGTRWLAHPGSAGHVPGAEALGAADAVTIAIGPEGGFSPAEVETAVAAGWQPVDLGQRILRVETAALALAATILLPDGRAPD